MQIDELPEQSTIYNLQSAILRPWVLPAVYERERSGQGTFLTEFRPAVALFLRFDGLDYDDDAAEGQLDTFIRRAQVVLERYDGALLQLMIGDKGSYFENLLKRREYLRRAGEAAQAAYANAAALDYYERLLPLLTEASELIEIRLKAAALLESTGRWTEAEAQYRMCWHGPNV